MFSYIFNHYLLPLKQEDMLGQNNKKIKQESNTFQQLNMCECLTLLYSNLKYCAVMHIYLTLLRGCIILTRNESTPAS